jgi:hypothetical protein
VVFQLSQGAADEDQDQRSSRWDLAEPQRHEGGSPNQDALTDDAL